MRKILALFAAVFALAMFIGASLPTADAAPCTYRCICSFPHKCCTVNGVETCKRVSNSPIQCPQNMPC